MDDFRKNIEKKPVLQQAADKLLRDLAKRMPSQQGEEILSAILDKSTQGLSLAEKYPKFEQMLVSDHALLRSFQELTELLNQENSEPEGFTSQKKPNLNFLEQSRHMSTIEVSAPTGWKVELRQTLDNLRNIFTPLSLAYRDPLGAVDNLWYSLLREEVTFEHSTLEIVLDASISEERAESLDLLLHVITIQIPKDQALPQSLSATLSWGNYRHSTSLNLNGQTRFPPADFTHILDASFENISADLTLVIQASE